MHRRRRVLLGFAVVALLVAAMMIARDAPLGPHDGHELPPADTGRVAVADIAPDFTLAAYSGGRVTLSQFRGSREIVLVFYRGRW